MGHEGMMSETPWRENVPPGTHEKWANVAPILIKEGVNATIGSRTAGAAAEIATKAAFAASPELKEGAGLVLRDVTYGGGQALLVAIGVPFAIVGMLVASVHDEFTPDPKKKWLKD